MEEMIYGVHTVRTMLKYAPDRFQKAFILQGRNSTRLTSLIHDFKLHGINIQIVKRQYLDKLKKDVVHQGVIAFVKPSKKYKEIDLIELIKKLNNPFLLILDGITDPHNLGACLRSANAAGVHAVIIPRDRSAQINAVVKKVACGATENIPIVQVTNLVRTMRLLQERNIWIIGTAGETNRTIYQSKMIGRIALVMGMEGKGIRRLTREFCDEMISIPMTGNISSLNVAVATGVCLFEAVRQRRYNK